MAHHRAEAPTLTTTVRRDVLGFVARYPAIHVREIERQLHLSSKLASYHLAALETDGLVRRIDVDGYVRWLATRTGATLAEQDVRLLCHLRRAPAFRIAGELLAHGELPANRLVRPLGLAKASVSYHLKALLAEGIVQARAEGRERLYSLVAPERVKRIILQFEPIPGELDEFSRTLLDLLGNGARKGKRAS